MFKIESLKETETLPAIKFTLNDEVYYGISDFIRRFDVKEFSEKYRVVNQTNQTEGNPYEVLWLIVQQILQKDFENGMKTLGMSEEELMDVVKWTYRDN